MINRATKTIGVFVPDVSHLFAIEVLVGIEEQAHEFGYSVMIPRLQEFTDVLKGDGITVTNEIVTT